VSKREPLPSWTVTIAEHDVPPRWHVGARTVTLGASTARIACSTAVRWAHADAGVPPLRSLLGVSMAHASAKPERAVAA
jgi:hypothetical protein